MHSRQAPHLQADHPGDLLQLFTYWVELPPSSPLAAILPTPDDARLMALALLRLQDVYNLPAHQVLTSVEQMNQVLTSVDQNQSGVSSVDQKKSHVKGKVQKNKRKKTNKC